MVSKILQPLSASDVVPTVDRPPSCLRVDFCLTLSAAVCLLKRPLDRVVDKLCPTLSLGTMYADIASGMVDGDGIASKLLRVKRNGSARLCTAEVQVSRLNKVAAERLLKTKLCLCIMTGRCGLADCKYAHGPRVLKHAPDLKKTKLCFEFL